MVDRSPAQITIGGCLGSHLISPLCEAITRERIFVVSKSDVFAPKTELDLLAARELFDDQFLLQLEDAEACYGKFEQLESFLIEHKIPFDRQTQGHHDYGACRVFYRPETGRERWPTDKDGTILVAVDSFWESHFELVRACAEWPDSPDRVEEICARQKFSLPIPPPALTEMHFRSMAAKLASNPH